MKIDEYKQNIMLSSGRFKEEKQYWLNKLAGEIQMAGVPVDYGYSKLDRYNKAAASYLLPPHVFQKISTLCNQSSLAIYIFLLAGVKYLLFRYLGEPDILIGMPPIREAINMLNTGNMVALRTRFQELDTFKELLLSVRDTVSEAKKYHTLPFDTIARLVDLPPFKTIVLLENIHTVEFPDELNSDLTLAFAAEEGVIKIKLEYNPGLYSKFSIKQVFRHLKSIFSLVVEDISVRLSAVDFLSDKEKKQILLEFNDWEGDYPKEKVLVELFEEQAQRRPDRLAADGIVIPLTGERDVLQISYSELDRRACSLGGILRAKGIRPNFLVGIMAERSLKMLIVLLGIFKSGGAYLPIDPGYPEERILYILKNSGLTILFTSENLKVATEFAGEIIDPDDLKMAEGGESKVHHNPDDIAYVIFTSGSTGNPKGAIVEHRGMMNHIYSKIDTLHINDMDIIAQNASHCFDISVWQFFTALLLGGKTVIYPDQLVMDPEPFINAVFKDDISILEVVPSFLTVVLDFLELESKDLLRLKYLVVTGEALKVNLVDRWLYRFPSVSMVNAYGPTEAADDITHYIIDTAPVGESIFIGKPIQNMKIYIVDEDMNICPISRVGEICVSGVGVGKGYLNDPEKTGKVFAEDPFSEQKLRVYRTGDLGRWLPDGNIEFLGRKDYQVKVRGFRIELEEIESELLKYGDIDDAVVVAREDENENGYLCGYMTSEKMIDVSLLRKYLSQRLPGYMVPPYIIQLERMPLTANGKIDRRKLPEPVENGDAVGGGEIHRTPIEERLIDVWQELLGVDGIGVMDNFFRLGGHSLKAASLGFKIQKDLGVAVPLQEILKRQTIRELGQYIETATDKVHLSIKPVEKWEYYEVSSSQKRLLIVSQMEGRGVSYNMPVGALLRGALDRERLEEVFQILVRRHQTFRTSFIFIDGQPFQRIHDEVDFRIEYYDLREDVAGGSSSKVYSLENIVGSFVRPFDLSRAPLLRVRLVENRDGENILLVDMHHTICDGMSEDILVGEFIRLYNSEALPLLRIQYKDFSQWQDRFFKSGGLRSQQDYWLDVFSGDIPILDLPTDYPRPSVQSFEGDVIQFETDGDLMEMINRLAQDRGTTLFMVLMAVYIVLLSKYSHQEDIVVGTPIAGRVHGDLENVIGMFVNTMAIRSFPWPDKHFSMFLEEIKQTSLRAYENQDYPFEELVERLNLQRDVSRNPLFDVLFVLQNIPFESSGRGNFEIEPFDLPMKTAKFDFILSAMETEDKLVFSLEYCTKLYRRQTVERLGGHFLKILKGILPAGESKLSEIDILTEEERRQILENLKGTEEPYPGDKTVIRLFEEEVDRAGDRMAVVGINLFGRHPDDLAQLSYRELSIRANRLGTAIKEMGVGRESIVSIMVEISVDMLIGILGIIKVGGAYLPISPQYPLERKLYLLEESQSVLLLVQKELMDHNSEFVDGLGRHKILYIPHETIYGKEAIEPDIQGGPEDLVYIIYTSGTTGGPKGVLVENKNVVRLVKNNNFIDCGQMGRLLQSGALEFDASTFEIWGTLLNGSSLYLLKKETILSASELEAAIDRYDIGTMWLTAPLFNQMLDANMELFSRLRNLLVGGDVLSVRHIKKLRSRFTQLKVINGYGPTENTTFSTTFLIERDYQESIPIGSPISNSTVYILNRSGQPVPLGVYGELYTGGDGVSRGYLNDPVLSFEKYLDNPFVAEDRLYRTGDLVRWLPDGIIEFLHRLDCQVKIRGYRIELAEIESRLLSHPVIKEAVVLVREEGGDKYLCAYFVGASSSNDDMTLSIELREYLSRKLPSYMIPSFFMRLENLPLTSNGKVDRRALPAPVVSKAEAYSAPLDKVEKRLVEIWSEVLGIAEKVIGIDSNFFEIGGHSLKATVLVSRIHRALEIKIPLVEIFKFPTIKEMAQYIKGVAAEKYESIKPVEKKEYHILSSSQKRLYILQQMESGNVNYNIPQTLPLSSGVDKKKVELTFRKLIARHESLRTSFVMLGDRPVQRIHRTVDFKVEDYGQELEDKLIKPFDLSQAPLLRVGLVGHPSQEGKSTILVDMHHIISDGVSNDILTREFLTLFSGGELPPLRLQYKDFAVWQNCREQRERVKGQEEYWLAVFRDDVPVLTLPYDYQRPPVQSFEGRMVGFECEAEATSVLRRTALNNGATLYMVLLSIFTILLSKLSGQEDIVVGTPVAGRRHADLDYIIGMFVNTLAMRNHPAGEKTYAEFLTEVIESTLKAYENQEFQFEDLVDRLLVSRNAGRNPLFDVMFTIQNDEDESVEWIEEVTGEGYTYRNEISKFDLTLAGVESDGKLLFTFQYCTKLFKEKSILRFIACFKRILSSIGEDAAAKLCQVEIVPENERRQILCEFNETEEIFPQRPVHQLFEDQVEDLPDHIVMVEKDGFGFFSFRKLNERSNQLGRLLRTKGVSSGLLVALIVEPSFAMMYSILGVLKSGGAYLPVDSQYPEARIRYILRDSGSTLFITRRDLVSNTAEICERVDLNDKNLFGGEGNNLPIVTQLEDAAYVIYTSGSTGQSKGVLIEHRSLNNLCQWHNKYYDVSSRDRASKYAGVGFDASVWEIFPYLIVGASIWVIDDRIKLEIGQLNDYFEKVCITIGFLPTQICEQFMYYPNVSLRILLTGGDKLRSYRSQCYRLVNNYGPTEGTVVSSSFTVAMAYENIPIGKPLSNARLYILDKAERLQPLGVAGELVIGGAGLARGYLNRPELTADKFVDWKGSRLYKTGDLVRWRADGNIEFLGRIDQQVKVRGFRIELGEIENALLQHDKITEAMVVARRDESGEIQGQYLCAYIVVSTTFDNMSRQLKEFLSRSLPEYMIPAYFTAVEHIPLNFSGKVDRQALPDPVVTAGSRYMAPRDEVEKKLAEIWSGLLPGRLPSTIPSGRSPLSIGIDDNFFELGGHSLRATILVSKIHKEFKAKVNLAQIFKTPTVRGLGAYIRSRGKDRYASIKAIEKRQYYPLSSAQKRLYILQQMDLSSTVYNMPQIIPLYDAVDGGKLTQTFIKMLIRHESLRTSFHMMGNQPVQRIHDQVDFRMESDVSTEIGFIRPFDLTTAPLLRVGLWGHPSQEGKYVLLVDMHHIISDGVSNDILAQEFLTLYSGGELPPLRFQYKDYAVWQNLFEQREQVKDQEAYWLAMFSHEIPVLHLPYDYPRPLVQSFEGNTAAFECGAEVTSSLRSTALNHGATLYMVLLTLFNILLSKLSGQEDIVVGTPVAGRRHADLDNIIGMFVNTLAMRSQPVGELTFKELLTEVKAVAVKAFDNQDYQFEDLVDKVDVKRDTGRNPLFDVMLAVQEVNRNLTDGRQFDSSVDQDRVEQVGREEVRGSAKFDITLTAVDTGDRLIFSLKYCKKLFRTETIRRFIIYFINIISGVIKDIDEPIGTIEMISLDEKQRLLHGFNTIKADIESASIPAEFEAQMTRCPDKMAVTFETSQLSYRELNRRADRLARVLIEWRLTANSIVALMTERSLDMLVGIFGILKAGGAYLPIDPAFPGERRRLMLADSDARLLVVGETITDNSETAVTPGGLVKLLLLKDIDCYGNEEPEFMVINQPGDLAYVIYTSGTSGIPKGVLVSHRNVIHLCRAIKERIITYEESVNVALVSPYVFDASIKQIFPALLGGHHLVIVPEAARLEGERLIRFLIEKSVRVSDGTPTHLSIILNEASRLTGDFPVEKFVIGGEELDVNLAGKFLQKLNRDDIEIVNVYGPTECTDVTSSFSVTPEVIEGLGQIPIGRPIPNINCFVLGRYGNFEPIGVPGELYITGAGVSRGYLNRPELTREKFATDRLAVLGEKRERYRIAYRTGDRVRWLTGGNMEFLGRVDQQVKIRGHRIELGEIESRLLRHPSIMKAVVVAQPDNVGGRFLAAYIVLTVEAAADRSAFDGEIRAYLSRTLPDYMIPLYFIQLDDIPVTFAGKVDRKALPMPEMRTGRDMEAPGDQLEMKLLDIWSEVLGIDREVIGVNTDFFKLGGHSLLATIMVSKIHMSLDIKIPLVEMFKSSTIKKLAGYIRGAGEEKYESIRLVEKREYYVLSSAQKRLFVLQQMEASQVNYNMPQAIPLPEKIDENKLQWAFKTLIRRHESLRTSFEMLDDQPVQRIHTTVDFKVEAYDQATADSFVQPFDLSQAPLLRVGLSGHPSQEGKYVLLVDMHHIISDAVSNDVLANEFLKLYFGGELPRLCLQYKDYAVWQNHRQQRTGIKDQEAFWLAMFSDKIPVLHLPYDYQRPPVQSFEGCSVNFELTGSQVKALRNVLLKKGMTLFMFMLAVFSILLSKLSGHDDVVVGVPIAGRRHLDLVGIIGMFVNTLALRCYPSAEKTIGEFLDEVKWVTVEGFDNQEYQFEELVERLEVPRDTSRNPLFDVMFNLLEKKNYLDESGELSDWHLGEHQKMNAKFDLSLTAEDVGNKLYFSMNYCTRLFKSGTIDRFIGFVETLVSAITGCLEPMEQKLAELEVITAAEKQMILNEFNDTGVNYPKDKNIAALFDDQVEPRKDEVVLAGGSLSFSASEYEQQVSYGKLNTLVGRLVGVLQKQGVSTGTITGLMIDRSLEMIVGILGVLKAGGAYVPIEPSCPPERASFILRDSGSRLLLSRVYEGKIKDIDVEGPVIDIADGISHGSMPVPTQSCGSSEDPAYILYTSGSTGKPKGVLVAHRSVVNIMCHLQTLYPLARDGVYLFKTSYTFDVSVTEIFSWIFGRGKLFVLGLNGEKDPRIIRDEMYRQRVTHVNFVPSMLNVFLDAFSGNNQLGLRRLQYILVAGEDFYETLAKKASRSGMAARFENIYGPTEATIYSTGFSLEAYEHEGSVPIGQPMGNIKNYVVDPSHYHLLKPSNIVGELCIGGVGVSRGYLNRPELTHEKFRLSPFDKGEMLYRTGDLARWREDGNLVFLGRIDHQVKIRGFRVELTEVESQILKHNNIANAAVVIKEDDRGDKYIVAYVVVSGIKKEEMESFLNSIRTNLSLSLHDYMIPTHFVNIDKIPLSVSGKLDRKALPEPEMRGVEEFVPSTDELEKRLVEIWSEVLGVGREVIGVNADFFKLGGHSLKATVMVSKIQRELEVELPLVEIFKRPTIRKLAEYIRERQGSADVSEYNNLILLKDEVAGAPDLFLVHDGTGEVDGYLEFCRHLKSEFNCRGIRADRLKNFIPLAVTIEQLARDYIGKIKALQAEGPYYLLGWSLGGTIAFEMVRQLELMGEKISFLVLVDAPGPDSSLKKDRQVLPFELDMNIHRTLASAREIYIPVNKIDTPVHYLKASRSRKRYRKLWQPYCNRRIRTYEINGDHYSILRNPQVAELARQFDRAISAL